MKYINCSGFDCIVQQIGHVKRQQLSRSH